MRSEFGTVERIVEARDAEPEELAGNEINAGLYVFDAAWLRRRIAALTPSAATGELYLTDLVRLAREDGRIVTAVAFEDDGRFDGINDRSQLAAAEWSMRVRLNEAHMRAGVTMRDPSTVYLDWTVELGPDVTLEPNVILRGATSVGAGSVIGAGSQLIDCDGRGERGRLGAASSSRRRSRTRRRSGRSATCGRGASSGAAPMVGNFAELKNTHLGPGSKQHHMSYLGDAEIGEGRQHRRRDDHRELRRHEQERDDDRRRRVHRRRHDARRPASRSVRARAPGAGAVVTRDVPAGKLAVGVPARIREPRAKPAHRRRTKMARRRTPPPWTRPARWTRSSRSSSSSC